MTTESNRNSASIRRPPEGGWDGLAARIDRWGRDLGFTAIGIAGTSLGDDEAGLVAWLDAGWHGGMDYMARHGV